MRISREVNTNKKLLIFRLDWRPLCVRAAEPIFNPLRPCKRRLLHVEVQNPDRRRWWLRPIRSRDGVAAAMEDARLRKTGGMRLLGAACLASG